MSPEEAVRAFFAAYTEGQPDRFDDIVSPITSTTATPRPASDRGVRGTTMTTLSRSPAE